MDAFPYKRLDEYTIMTFMAGIFDFKGLDPVNGRARFNDTLVKLNKYLHWPLDGAEEPNLVFARCGFGNMWQGPKLLSANSRFLMACGVQGRKIPGHKNALEYLAGRFGQKPPCIDDYFDRFSLVIADKTHNKLILATDPLGISPLYYHLRGSCIVFSSHQVFLKHFLGMKSSIDWQGVLEYLVIGHCMGDRTLLHDTTMLSPGTMLVFSQKGIQTIPYFSVPTVVRDANMDDAVQMILDDLRAKIDAYGFLNKRPYAGFLSGGWDSRLLAAIFAEQHGLDQTFTTQQQVRVQGMLVSEKKIAKEVSRFLGVKNTFIAPVYRTHGTRDIRAKYLDYTTWFHDWAFSMVERLPWNKYLFFDGLLGDILLRGLFITPELASLLRSGARAKVAEIFHNRYVSGFNPYTRGTGQWEKIFTKATLEQFSEGLKKSLYLQFHKEDGYDFITPFLIHNRSRRAIAPLPVLLFGSKGEVVLPFCDTDFVKKVLALPLELRIGGDLYRELLEKVRPGLSRITSTNNRDLDQLKSYLTSSVYDLTLKSRVNRIMERRVPLYKKLHDRILGKDLDQWAKQILQKPPEMFFPYLNDPIKKAIDNADLEALKQYRFFLDRIMILDHYSRLE